MNTFWILTCSPDLHAGFPQLIAVATVPGAAAAAAAAAIGLGLMRTRWSWGTSLTTVLTWQHWWRGRGGQAHCWTSVLPGKVSVCTELQCSAQSDFLEFGSM